MRKKIIIPIAIVSFLLISLGTYCHSFFWHNYGPFLQHVVFDNYEDYSSYLNSKYFNHGFTYPILNVGKNKHFITYSVRGFDECKKYHRNCFNKNYSYHYLKSDSKVYTSIFSQIDIEYLSIDNQIDHSRESFSIYISYKPISNDISYDNIRYTLYDPDKEPESFSYGYIDLNNDERLCYKITSNENEILRLQLGGVDKLEYLSGNKLRINEALKAYLENVRDSIINLVKLKLKNR